MIARASRNAPSADRLTRVGATFSGPGLSFDSGSSEQYADVVGRRRRAGAPSSIPDAEIAAIGRQRSASLATWNGKDFAGVGVDLIDPWSANAV